MGVVAAAAPVIAGAVSTFTSTAVGAAVLKIAVGTALSTAAQIALRPDAPGEARFELKGRVQASGVVPRSIPLGKTVAQGSLAWHSEWGPPSKGYYKAYTQVIALSDVPVRGLRRVAINDEWVTLGPVPAPSGAGFPVLEYRREGDDHAWIKFYDGTQTEADPYLVNVVSPYGPRTYGADRVGRGTAYLIATFWVDEVLFSGIPNVRAEVDGARLYDVSQDSTAGGNGDHRWNDPTTWGGEGDRLPAVQAYNILRGLRDIDGQVIYGADCGRGALPAAEWIAQIQRCRAEIEHNDGMVPRWRTGGVVPVDTEPKAAIEAILASCAGRLYHDGAKYRIWIGSPPAASATLSDGDILDSEVQSFAPIQRLSERINGATGRFPDPAQLWEYAALPTYLREDIEAKDGGRRLLADVPLDFCTSLEQGQRVLRAAVREAQRARRLTFRVNPDLRTARVGDVVAYTSARNGFLAKEFRIEGRLEHPTGDCDWELIEVDPSDYDWDTNADFTPLEPGRVGRVPPVPQPVDDFSVQPWVVKDRNGGRHPAIRMNWDRFADGVRGVLYRVRLAGTAELVTANGRALHGDGSAVLEGVTWGGEAATWGGEDITYLRFDDVGRGHGIISEGIGNETDYEVQAAYEPRDPRRSVVWTDWLPVRSGNAKIRKADLEQEIVERIDTAFEAAANFADQITAIDIKATQSLNIVNQLGDEALADLQAALDAIGDVNIDVITSLRSDFEAADAALSQTVVTLADDVQALAGSSAVLSADFNPDNLIRNASFPDGPLDPGERPRFWQQWPAAFSVVERSTGGSSALDTATAPQIVAIAQGPTDVEAISARAVAEEGDEFTVSFAYATGGASPRSADIALFAVFRDADGDEVGSQRARVTATATTWAKAEKTGIIAPAGTATVEAHLQRFGGGSGVAYVHSPRLWMSDRTISARVAQQAVAVADAEASIATINATVSAEFGSLNSALAQVQQTATATAERAASALVLRAVAGGGDAGVRVVAWDDTSGVGGVVYLDGTIIAPQTLSAAQLVVQDHGYNHVPDDQLQSKQVWATDPDWSIVPQTGRPDASSRGELRYVGGFGVGNKQSTGQMFPCRPGEKIACAFEIDRNGGSSYSVSAAIRWSNRAGGGISQTVIASYTGTNSGLQRLTGTVTAPAGAYGAQWRWLVDTDNTNGMPRFFAPEAIRQAKGEVLIEPNGITAREANFEDLASLNLQVVTADIVDLSVTELKIADNAVSWPSVAYTIGALSRSNQDDWVTIQSVTVTKNRSDPITVKYGARWNLYGPGFNSLDGESALKMRMLRDGEVIKPASNYLAALGSGGEADVLSDLVDFDLWSGTRTYEFQVKDHLASTSRSFTASNRLLGVSGFGTLKK